jgi:hypothetical protein
MVYGYLPFHSMRWVQVGSGTDAEIAEDEGIGQKRERIVSTSTPRTPSGRDVRPFDAHLFLLVYDHGSFCQMAFHASFRVPALLPEYVDFTE